MSKFKITETVTITREIIVEGDSEEEVRENYDNGDYDEELESCYFDGQYDSKYAKIEEDYEEDDYDEEETFDMTEKEIRENWESALEQVKDGTDLSSKIGYGFSDKDITELAKLHKANKFREKIEDLLTDCNFHYECGQFANGEYEEFLKEEK